MSRIRVSAPAYFLGIDVKKICRNFGVDNEGNSVRMGVNSDAYRALATMGNHLLAHHPLVIFQKTQPINQVTTTGLNPLYRYKYMDDNPNGRTITGHVIAQYPTTEGNSYLSLGQNQANTSFIASNIGANVQWFNRIFYSKFTLNRGDDLNAFVDNIVSTYEGYTVLSFNLQEDDVKTLDTNGGYTAINPNFVARGETVRSNSYLYDRLHERRSRGLGTTFSWSAQGTDNAVLAPGNAGAIAINCNAYVNLFDQDVNTRTMNTPGASVDKQYAGIGTQQLNTGLKIRQTPWVYGQLANSDFNATIKFIGPEHFANNDIEINIIGGAAPAWYGGTDYKFYLNPAVAYNENSVNRNKIDIHGKITASNNDDATARIWALSVHTTYDADA